MANFWAGVGQGFSGGFEKAWDSAARRRERREDREQALKDAATRKKDAQDIAERARQNKLTDLKMQLEREAIKERQGQEAILESLSPEARKKALGDRLLFTGLQPETPAMLEGLDMGEVGRLDKYDTMTPSELQGTGLAGQRIEKELLAERVAEKAAERALELEKSKLGLKTGAETEKDKKELVGGILSKYGQLGDKTPTPDFDALMLMSPGQLRKLDGGLDTRLAERKAKQPTASDSVIMDALKLANPQASPAQLAKLLLAHKENKGDYLEVRDPVTENLIFRKGQKPTSTSKDDASEPSEYDNAILMLKQIKDRFDPKNPSVGWVATAKSIIGDDILPQFQIKSLADEDRRKYQHLVGEFGVTYTKALNAPDSRLSDMDVLRLEKLAPKKTDSPFAFQAKIQEIDDKLRTLQRFRTAYGKDINIWEMDWRDVLDARKRATPEQESLINDDLAAFILQESHGLKGSSEEGFMKSLGEKVRKGGINEEEYKFWMRSVFPKR